MNKKILIIQTQYLGDVLASSSIAHNLKRFNSSYTIHFFCYDNATSILKNNPSIDKLISCSRQRFKSLTGFFSMYKQLQKEKYDIIIDPYSKLLSILLTTFLAPSVSIAKRKTLTNYTYTNPVNNEQIVDRGACQSLQDRLRLLNPIVSRDFKKEYAFYTYLTDSEKKEGKKWLLDAGVDMTNNVVMIGVLGSSQQKTFPLPEMAKLIRTLQQLEVSILFNYIPSQQDEVDTLLAMLPSQENIYSNVVGGNVREFLQLVANCDAYIGNEGGGTNMSKSQGIPTFTIFAPFTQPEVWNCMDNQKHDYVHLKQFTSKGTNRSQKDLREKASYYFKQYDTASIEQQMVSFLQTIL